MHIVKLQLPVFAVHMYEVMHVQNVLDMHHNIIIRPRLVYIAIKFEYYDVDPYKKYLRGLNRIYAYAT